MKKAKVFRLKTASAKYQQTPRDFAASIREQNEKANAKYQQTMRDFAASTREMKETAQREQLAAIRQVKRAGFRDGVWAVLSAITWSAFVAIMFIQATGGF